jgi:hypothetical protein
MSSDTAHTARLYLESHDGDMAVMTVPGTDYQLHLRCAEAPEATPQGRLLGTIHTTVWKLDEVNEGGAYIEPIFGRPRRIQGTLVAADAQLNQVVVEVSGCPVVGQLPEQWQADQLTIGQTIALEVADGATFLPAT